MPLLLLPPPTPTSNQFPTAAGALSARIAVEWSPTTSPTGTPVWVDVSEYVRAVSLQRGRNHELDRFEAGTATIVLDNRTRLFDPTYTAGTYYGNLLPMKRWRFRLQNPAVSATYPVFQGYAESYAQSYMNPTDATCTVSLVDAFKVFAMQSPKSPWSLQVDGLGPTAWYRMGEASTDSMLDSSANGYDGLYYNSPTQGVTGLVESDVNEAVTFASASSEYAQVTTIPAYTQWHGVETWFATTASAAQTLVMWGDSSGRPLIGIEMDASGHLDFVEYYIGGNQTNHRVTTDTYNDGGSHHVAYGIVPNGGWVAVIDGQYVLQGVTVSGYKRVNNTPVAGVEFTTAANTWTFGGRGNGAQFFDGTLDEVVVYVDDVWSPTISNGTELYTGFGAEMVTHYGIGQDPWVDDLIDERADHILDSIDWPAGDRDFGVGTVEFQAANFGSNTVLEEFARMNATEFGRLFVGRSGELVIQARYDSLGEASAATFGDSGSEHRYADVIVNYDDSQIYNMVIATRTGGSDMQVSDATSMGSYYTRSFTTSDLLYQDDDSTRTFANVVLQRYKDPALRVSALTILPERAASTLYDAVYAREIGDVVTVRRRPQGVGSAIEQELLIEGIQMDVIPDGAVSVTWQLGQNTSSDYWVLGNTQAGVLGTTTFLGA